MSTLCSSTLCGDSDDDPRERLAFHISRIFRMNRHRWGCSNYNSSLLYSLGWSTLELAVQYIFVTKHDSLGTWSPRKYRLAYFFFVMDYPSWRVTLTKIVSFIHVDMEYNSTLISSHRMFIHPCPLEPNSESKSRSSLHESLCHVWWSHGGTHTLQTHTLQKTRH